MTFFSRLRIKARIFSGFGALVALGVAVTVFGVWQLMSVDTQVGRLFGMSENSARNLEVAQLVETMRRSALRFRTSADASAADDFKTAEAKSLELLDIARNSTPNQERKRLSGEAMAGIGELRKSFDHLVDQATKAQNGRAALFNGGDVLSAASSKLVEGAPGSSEASIFSKARDLEAAIHLVQIANWRFLATTDANGPAVFEASLEKASTLIAEFEQVAADAQLQGLLAPVKASLTAYGRSFGDLAATLLETEDLYEKELRPRVIQLSKITEQMQAALRNDLQGTKINTDSMISTTITTQEALVLVLLGLGIALAVLIGRGIANPVVAMTRAMTGLAQGDSSIEIPARDKTDEIGDMAKAVEVFKENMIKADALAAEQRTEQQAKEARQAKIAAQIKSFDLSVRSLLDTLGSAATEMRATAESMSATAEETSRQSTTVASASEQASANVQTIAAATEEMAASISEIASQVTMSSTIAAKAAEDAERSNATMQDLSQAAQKIGDVVALITSIASQTNLLALNATIEAARAGDAGKGFAVVASEVKSLANQTAKATDDIAAQITAIQTASQQAVTVIRNIGDTIGQMNEISAAIAAAMEQQGATTHEITRNAQDAARGTNEVQGSIAGVTEAAGETGAAATQVLSSAGELGKQAETLREKVGSFLAEIAAA